MKNKLIKKMIKYIKTNKKQILRIINFFRLLVCPVYFYISIWNNIITTTNIFLLIIYLWIFGESYFLAYTLNKRLKKKSG